MLATEAENTAAMLFTTLSEELLLRLCLLIDTTFEPAKANAAIRLFLPCFKPC